MLELSNDNKLIISSVEKGFNIKVLFSFVNGGRQIGISRKNSDVDISFMYVPMKETEFNKNYIRIYTDNYDFLGKNMLYYLDLYKKFVINYNKNLTYTKNELHNAYLFFVYLNAPVLFSNKNFVEKIRPYTNNIFYDNIAIEFYIDKINLNYKTIFTDVSKTKILLRSILYTYRSIFSTLWVIKYNTIPPTLIEDLYCVCDDKYIIKTIKEYKKNYCNTNDKGISVSVDDKILNYISEIVCNVTSYKNKLSNKEINLENINIIQDIVTEYV